jgi:protocatechuate 3,4-dioxygenase alpha subunit
MSVLRRGLPSQTIGPFYHFALTMNDKLGCLAVEETKGERIWLRLRLLDGDGVAVPDGMLELWQADAGGIYSHPADAQHPSCDCAFFGFGRLGTDADGVCLFETIRPGRVGSQAAHINVSVFARGLLGRLVTRVYFAGDEALSGDPVLGLVPADRRPTLIAERDPGRVDQWNLDIHLQGERETVFFDI